jgi:hypothetical protein
LRASFLLAISVGGAAACSSKAADEPPPRDASVSLPPPDAGPEASPPPSEDASSTVDAADATEDLAPPLADAAPRDVGPDAPSGSKRIIVAAGAFDRLDTIVTFALPDGIGKTFALRGEQGVRLALQVDAGGVASFVLPSLAAGREATFDLEATAAPTSAVTAVRESDGIRLAIGATTLVRYQMQGKLPPGIDPVYLRGGYLHPVFTPSGAQVTDDYPSDHRHHHGIWGAWTKTTFNGHMMDFWNMGEKTAKVDFDSLDATWDGAVHAGFRSRHVYVDLVGPQPVTALREQWSVRAYAIRSGQQPYFVFELESTQEAATSMPVVFEQYLYGGFAVRGSAQWRTAATFLTSEGRDRTSGDGTNARWCYIGGNVDGKPAGYAILGHPSNFRAPQPVRIHPTDPYATFSPVKESGFSIVPGTPYVTRFRFVSADGAPDKALIDRLWNDFATPPQVTVR